MAKKKTNWPLLGLVVGVCAAPFTGGASLAMAGKVLVPTLIASGGLGFVGGKVIEVAVDNGDSDDNTSKIMDEWKIKNEQWKAQMEADAAERKRLREEQEKAESKIKNNNDEIARLNAVINNPHSSKEEKENARKRIILLEDNNKKLRKDLDKITKDIEEKSKTPSAPSRPWNSYLPNLKFMDKVILAGGIVLITYLLISRDSKK